MSKRVIICGGGAIGAAIAYFLARRGAVPIVVERHEVGGAASGKSGGFLAYDWCRGSALDRLARLLTGHAVGVVMAGQRLLWGARAWRPDSPLPDPKAALQWH